MRLVHIPISFPILLLLWIGTAIPIGAQTITLQQAAGGVTVSGAASPFSTGFGNVNGLGIGTPATGLTMLSVSGGYFYYTPYTMVLSGSNPGHPAIVSAYISANFTNSTSVIQLMSCAYPGPCTSFSNFSNMPTTQATEITVLPTQTAGGNYTAYLGLFVPDFNGTITSSDSATVNFDVFDANHNTTTTVQLKLNNPSVTVQSAVELQLATAASGVTITATGSNPDYTASFGNVNGLGIGPGAGLTIVTGQVSNGSLYATPYTISPAFSGFASTSGTTVTVYGTGFTHSTILKLYDSASSTSGYGLISTSSGSPTTITSSAANGTNITRYLGLFVSNVNGAGSFRGSDSATLTYTITVQ